MLRLLVLVIVLDVVVVVTAADRKFDGSWKRHGLDRQQEAKDEVLLLNREAAEA
jgi:hypothetical protein